jgi:hypothetical protein
MFAEMPLDNRTVNKSAALFALVRIWPPLQAFTGPLELYRAQHDLMFRRG